MPNSSIALSHLNCMLWKQRPVLLKETRLLPWITWIPPCSPSSPKMEFTEIIPKLWQIVKTLPIRLKRSITITNMFNFMGVPVCFVNDSRDTTNLKPMLVYYIIIIVVTVMNIIRLLLIFGCHDPICSYWLHDYTVIAKNGS